MSRVFDAYYFSSDYNSEGDGVLKRKEDEWWEWQEHESQKEEDLYTYELLNQPLCQPPSIPTTD